MARLIDADEMKADELGAFISAQAQTTDSVRRGIQEIVHAMLNQLIDDAPTVDAVEVVRCKECKNYVRHDHRCGRMNHGFKDDFFCALGEGEEANER